MRCFWAMLGFCLFKQPIPYMQGATLLSRGAYLLVDREMLETSKSAVWTIFAMSRKGLQASIPVTQNVAPAFGPFLTQSDLHVQNTLHLPNRIT